MPSDNTSTLHHLRTLRLASLGEGATLLLLLLVAAFVPFGAFMVGGIFKRKNRALTHV